MAVWPNSVANDTNLFVAVNALQSALASSISSGATSIALVSTTGFPVAGAVAIDNEVIFYTSISGGSLQGCTRGADGTVAAAHIIGALVGASIVAIHHNSLKNEIEAIEQNLSDRIGLGSGSVHFKGTAPWADVKAYGAVGDGVTDDFTAVQAAITAIYNAGGGVVYLPEGTYLIGSKLQIFDRVSMYGAARGATILKAKNGLNDRLLVNGGGGAPDKDIVLQDLVFDMNGINQTATTAVTFSSTLRHAVRRCNFINPYDSLYLLTGSPAVTNNTDPVFEDVLFDGTGQVSASDIVDIGSSTNVRYTRCKSYNCKSGTGDALVVFGIIQTLTVTDSLFDANGNGTPVVIVGINGGKIDGCEMRNGFEAGIRLTYWNEISPSYPLKDFEVVNNNIHDNGFDGIWMNHAGVNSLIMSNITVANNSIWNNQQSGIRCLIANGVTIANNHIYNNSLAGVGSYYAINLNGAFSGAAYITNIRVMGNHFYDNQGTATQTKLYTLTWADGFYSNNNIISQISTFSTLSNATNVVMADVNKDVIPVVAGGTGLTAFAQGDLLYCSATGVLTALPKNGNASRYLSNLGTSNAPEWDQVNLTNGVSGTLPIASGGTGSGTPLVGSKVMRSVGTTIVEDVLTSDGAGTFGNVTAVISATANPATTGLHRLAKSDVIAWRNNGNTGNLLLTKNTSDDLQYNGFTLIKQVGTGLTQTGDTAALTIPVVIANGGTNSVAALNNNRVMKSASGAIVEAAAITANMAVISDANGIPATGGCTATELSYVSGVTSALQTQLNAARAKIGTFTYDLSTASGTQVITGVGFTPKTVIFMAATDGGLKASYGVDDGTTHAGFSLISGSTNWWGSNSIIAYDGAGNYQLGAITAFSSDGFTITWAKTGSPTGTYHIIFQASR